VESWLIDLGTRTITVYRTPGPDGYEQSVDVEPGDRINLIAFPDETFGTEEILGR
jgi:Uma2 family endonuclease